MQQVRLSVLRARELLVFRDSVVDTWSRSADRNDYIPKIGQASTVVRVRDRAFPFLRRSACTECGDRDRSSAPILTYSISVNSCLRVLVVDDARALPLNARRPSVI